MTSYRVGRAAAALFFVSAVLCGCNGGEIERLTAENADLEGQVSQLEMKERELTEALEEANEHIRQAASDISEVQVFAYGSCSELKFQVTSLDEPEEVDEP